MKRLLTSLLVAGATLTPMFTIGNYVSKTRDDSGTFCTRWDKGVYQTLYKARFAHLQGHERINQLSGLRTRDSAFRSLVETCEGEYPTFGIES